MPYLYQVGKGSEVNQNERLHSKLRGKLHRWTRRALYDAGS